MVFSFGYGVGWMDDILVPATTSVSRPRLTSLEPWDLDALKPYEPAFLSGFKAQRYQVELPEGFEEAKLIMASIIEEDVRKDIGGDEQRIDDIALLLGGYLQAHSSPRVHRRISIQGEGVSGDGQRSHWRSAGRSPIQLLEDLLLRVVLDRSHWGRGLLTFAVTETRTTRRVMLEILTFGSSGISTKSSLTLSRARILSACVKDKR